MATAALNENFINVQPSPRISVRVFLQAAALNPYSKSIFAATSTCPDFCTMLGSEANAAIAHPINCGDSELLRSKNAADSITLSFLTRPGYKDTTPTLCSRSSCAMSAVILSVAALDTLERHSFNG